MTSLYAFSACVVIWSVLAFFCFGLLVCSVYVPFAMPFCSISFIFVVYVLFRHIIVFFPLSDSANMTFGCARRKLEAALCACVSIVSFGVVFALRCLISLCVSLFWSGCFAKADSIALLHSFSSCWCSNAWNIVACLAAIKSPTLSGFSLVVGGWGKTNFGPRLAARHVRFPTAILSIMITRLE